MATTDPIFKGENLELTSECFQWNENELLTINPERLKDFSLPDADFIQPKFDTEFSGKLTSAVLLISSPRSGSTALCSYLYRKTGLVAHEYFQPFQYLPFLAQQWGCTTGNRIDPQCYMKALAQHRASNGVLGVNLHGSHLNIYEVFERQSSEQPPKVAIYLKRRDKVAQAVSYYIASNTRAWSSHFEKVNDLPSYSFSGIRAKLINLLNQEKRAELYLAKHKIPSQTLWYEDLVFNRIPLKGFLQKSLGVGYLTLDEASTKRQAGLNNIIYAERFMRELVTNG